MNQLPSDTGQANAPLPPNVHSRIFTLDVLRGVAVFGMLIISIWALGGFTTAAQQQVVKTHTGGNYKLYSIISILFEGKMRGLFSLVFGAGIILFLSRKQHPAALPAADLYMRRHIWLMAFGIFAGVILLNPEDILFQYGVLGILLFPFWRMKSRALLILAIFTTLIYCGKLFWNYRDDQKAYGKYAAIVLVEKQFSKDSLARAKADSIYWRSMPGIDTAKKYAPLAAAEGSKPPKLYKDSLNKLAAKDTLTRTQKKDKGAWQAIKKRATYDTAGIAKKEKTIQGSYGPAWTMLIRESQNKEISWLYKIGIWDIGSMMFLGMALIGFGFFQTIAIKKYWLIAIPSLLIGLFLAWLRIDLLHDRMVDIEKYTSVKSIPYNFLFPVERLLLAIGYASILLWLIRVRIFEKIWQFFALAGRMAFSLYMLQTLICTILFYGYGLGYYARLSQLELYIVVAEVWVIQIAFVLLWFNYYTIGPLEWLWRRLIYGRWFPIRKVPINDSITETSNL